MQPTSARKMYNVFVVTSCAAVVAASMSYILIWHKGDDPPRSEGSAEGTEIAAVAAVAASDTDTAILGAKRDDNMHDSSPDAITDAIADASYPILGLLISREDWRTGNVSILSQPYKLTDDWSDGFFT